MKFRSSLLTVILMAIAMSAKAEAHKLLVYNFTEVNYNFDLFQTQTGVTVEVDHSDSNLLWTKLNDPQNAAKPDLLLFDDVTEFSEYAKKGWFGPINSKILSARIPNTFRDLKSGWVGLSFRARTMVYNPQLVKASELSTYEDLADPRWKGRLCLRKGTYKYSQAMVADLMLADGIDVATRVVRGWVANNAQPIFAGDQPLVQALESGKCGVALVNTQYLATYKTATPNSQLQLFWANQNDRGVHVNITGAALFYQSPNPGLATRLLEYVASNPQAAAAFADPKLEYPTNLEFRGTNAIVNGFGGFKYDTQWLSKIGATAPAALSLNIRSGYSP